MNESVKIIEMKNEKNAYSVPEGYFDSLRERLSEIPARKSSGRIFPATALALAALTGAFILIATLRPNLSTESRTAVSGSLTEEEIIEYLIDAGASSNYFDE